MQISVQCFGDSQVGVDEIHLNAQSLSDPQYTAEAFKHFFKNVLNELHQGANETMLTQPQQTCFYTLLYYFREVLWMADNNLKIYLEITKLRQFMSQRGNPQQLNPMYQTKQIYLRTAAAKGGSNDQIGTECLPCIRIFKFIIQYNVMGQLYQCCL